VDIGNHRRTSDGPYDDVVVVVLVVALVVLVAAFLVVVVVVVAVVAVSAVPAPYRKYATFPRCSASHGRAPKSGYGRPAMAPSSVDHGTRI